MDIEQLIVGFLFLVLGGLNAVRPDFLIRLQVWTQKAIMGAQYIPSKRTYTAGRIFGAVFAVLGLLILTGAIR